MKNLSIILLLAALSACLLSCGKIGDNRAGGSTDSYLFFIVNESPHQIDMSQIWTNYSPGSDVHDDWSATSISLSPADTATGNTSNWVANFVYTNGEEYSFYDLMPNHMTITVDGEYSLEVSEYDTGLSPNPCVQDNWTMEYSVYHKKEYSWQYTFTFTEEDIRNMMDSLSESD